MRAGDRFDTPYEGGCVVTSEPDARGDFLALDSDGVECQFNESMVVREPLAEADTCPRCRDYYLGDGVCPRCQGKS